MWPYTVELYQHALTGLTIGEDQAINALAVLSDLSVGCNTCLPCYQPDQTMYVAPQANTGSPGDYANVWYSVNGGGAFAATSANPFSAGDSIKFILINFISDTQFRVIVISDQTTAQLKYADVTLCDEGTTTWSAATTIGAAAVEAAAWLFYNRLYIAVAGDIYLSDDQGATVGSAIYTGATQINAFAKSPVDGSVIAVGNTNLILQEVGQSGTFTVKTGPTGGGNFTSAFIASDGTLYAGNGTALYKSNNSGGSASGWTQLKDFGTNHTVVAINCAGGTKSQGGDSQLVRVVVNDAVAADGDVWETVDGGSTWTEVTNLTNTGYLGAYFSPVDDNLAFVYGNGGTIQKMAAKTP